MPSSRKRGKFEPFKPEAKISTGSVTVGGQSIRLPGNCGHAHRASEGMGRRAARSKGREGEFHRSRRRRVQKPHGRSFDVLCRLFQDRRRPPARDLSLQRRSRLRHPLAAHGRLWAAAHRHVDRCAHAGRAVLRGQQRREPARCHRPRLHRCSGYRLQPHRRQGQGEGFLRQSIRTPTPSRSSFRSFSQSTAAGIRPSICSARAMARLARRF